MAIMTVPEATVREQDGIVARKHDVGLAGQLRRMETKAETGLVETASQDKL